MKLTKVLKDKLGIDLTSEESPPIKTIIFCDPGIDDLLMLVQILSSPDKYDVVGIVPVSGNTSAYYTTANTLAVCELLGKSEIPVYLTSDYENQKKIYEKEKEMTEENKECWGKETDVYGKNGLGEIKLTPAKIMQPRQNPNGIDFTVEALKKEKHLLIFTGPLTEPAKIFQQLKMEQPAAFNNIIAISMMGGVINPTQNANWPIEGERFSEYNLAKDPESSKKVFDICKDQDIQILLATLDLTHSILVSESDMDLVRKVENPASNLVWEIIENVPEHYKKLFQIGPDTHSRQPLHDFHSSNCLLHPALYNGRWISVDVDSNISPQQMRINENREKKNVFLLNYNFVDRVKFFVSLAKDLEYFQYLKTATEKSSIFARNLDQFENESKSVPTEENARYTIYRTEKNEKDENIWREVKNPSNNLSNICLIETKSISCRYFRANRISDTLHFFSNSELSRSKEGHKSPPKTEININRNFHKRGLTT